MRRYTHLVNQIDSFLSQEVKKRSFSRVILGLSGGLDSAVVALLARRVFADDLICVMMPSHHSSSSSLSDAQLLCKEFDLRCITASIEPMLRYFEEQNPDANLQRVGNFSARLRMATLYDLSAKYDALVLGTSNKSELLLGYTTLYGDLASAINPIGSLYKSEIFELARYLGVSKSIINKPPSADLYEGQSDEGDLGYSYDKLDAVLRSYIDEALSRDELISCGYEAELVEFVQKRVITNRFKSQLPLVATFGGE